MEVYAIGGKPLMLDGKLCKVAAGGGNETWVLNEGQEYWLPVLGYTYAQQTPQFISNGMQFYGLFAENNILTYFTGPSGATEGNYVVVCYETNTFKVTFVDQAYRTLIFLEPPTGELLAWLQNNGVKQ